MLYYMSGSKWSVYILYNIILQCEYIYILLLLYTGIHLVENISCTCYVRVQIWQTILGDAIVLSYCHAALRNLLHPNMSKDSKIKMTVAL